MKLAFDATSLDAAGKGVARFQREFLRAAAEHDLVAELEVFVPEHPAEDALPQVPGWRYHRVRARPMLAWEQLRRPALSRRLGVGAVITLSERAALWGPPEIAYVYEHPKHRIARTKEVGKSARQQLVDGATLALFRLALRRAACVLAASEATARDLAPHRRAPVVYSGVGSEFTPARGAKEYLLHLASDDPRDNSLVVIDAYARLGQGRPRLVVAGPVRRQLPKLQARAAELEVDDAIEWRGFQAGDELVELYRRAIAYVDPSLYEGFGLQAAEALACGTAVIASNVTSLPEVVGDAGILLDPHDVGGFAEAMRMVVSDEQLRDELGRRAVAQAARFRWENTVRAIVATAQRVADGERA